MGEGNLQQVPWARRATANATTHQTQILAPLWVARAQRRRVRKRRSRVVARERRMRERVEGICFCWLWLVMRRWRKARSIDGLGRWGSEIVIVFAMVWGSRIGCLGCLVIIHY